jgi:outer membrane protein assembly factor BamB
LNLESGTTVSKYKIPLSRTGRFNVGFGNIVYSIGSNYDSKEDERIYISSMNPLEKEKIFLLPNYTLTKNVRFNGYGRIYCQIAFKQDNQEFLALTIINQISTDLPNNTSGVIEINLYNLTKKEWVYQKMPVRTSGKSIGGFDLIYKDKQIYFMSSDYVYCHNAQTGEEKWATLIGSAPLTSRMTLQNNRLYAACEDRFLYCLDINTGQVLWKEQNTGTCSPISYLNGVLYYLGGGDGKLHAVDADTGKHLWKLNSPDVTKNSGAFFYGVCAAVLGKNGQKGRVIGTTGLNAYCFEAIR